MVFLDILVTFREPNTPFEERTLGCAPFRNFASLVGQHVVGDRLCRLCLRFLKLPGLLVAGVDIGANQIEPLGVKGPPLIGRLTLGRAGVVQDHGLERRDVALPLLRLDLENERLPVRRLLLCCEIASMQRALTELGNGLQILGNLIRARQRFEPWRVRQSRTSEDICEY